MDHKIHEGRNVKRFREMLGIKQEALAYALGEEWTQKKVSLLEAREEIEGPVLAQVSSALKIPVEAFKNFDEEQALNVISSTFGDHTSLSSPNFGSININPIEKWVEALEEIKRLNAEIIRMKDQQIELLQTLLDKK